MGLTGWPGPTFEGAESVIGQSSVYESQIGIIL